MAERLVITASSIDARRSLGPLAWAALETVALDTMPDAAGVHGAATTVRTLAEQLEVNKDTAGRALARLIDRGYLHRVDGRTASRYQLTDAARAVLGLDEVPVVVCPRDPDEVSAPTCRPAEPDSTEPTMTRAGDAGDAGAPRRANRRRTPRRPSTSEQLALLELSPND